MPRPRRDSEGGPAYLYSAVLYRSDRSCRKQGIDPGRCGTGSYVRTFLRKRAHMPRSASGWQLIYACHVKMGDDPKAGWVSSFPAGPADKDSLARIVDADGGRDAAENSYYEAAADPSFVQMETAPRRFRGQYHRRLKRPAHRDQSRKEPWSRGTTSQ